MRVSVCGRSHCCDPNLFDFLFGHPGSGKRPDRVATAERCEVYKLRIGHTSRSVSRWENTQCPTGSGSSPSTEGSVDRMRHRVTCYSLARTTARVTVASRIVGSNLSLRSLHYQAIEEKSHSLNTAGVAGRFLTFPPFEAVLPSSVVCCRVLLIFASSWA